MNEADRERNSEKERGKMEGERVKEKGKRRETLCLAASEERREAVGLLSCACVEREREI